MSAEKTYTKDEVLAMLKDLQLEMQDLDIRGVTPDDEAVIASSDVDELIKERIDILEDE